MTLYHQVVAGERTANTRWSGRGKRVRITRTQSRELTCSHRLGKRIPLVPIVGMSLASTGKIGDVEPVIDHCSSNRL